jgi:probable phosphoglycerate mutase
VPFAALHHSVRPRAAQTADIVAGFLPAVPRHACDRVADRTPVPSPGRRGDYPERYLRWLDGVPADERDVDATALRASVAHFGATGGRDELLITHNFVICWFVRHALDAPQWRWIGLNQANCGLTVIGGDSALHSFNDVGHLTGLA